MNLDAYLARVGYDGRTVADYETLRRIHHAHATAIPFENLDIQMGLPVDLALPSLERKLVVDRRGGYCFEQNSLLLAALRAIGFPVIACEARVFDAGAQPTPRTHMLLLVSLPTSNPAEAGFHASPAEAGFHTKRLSHEQRWLSDVGFGGGTPLEPVPLDGTAVEQGGTRYRVAARPAPRHANPAEAGFHVLQADEGNGWMDQYVFEVSPREAIDFEVGNWYTSTHPESRFVKTLTAQQRTTTGSKVLRNLQWTVRSASGIAAREIARDELEALLAAEFGIRLPAGARFRALDGEAVSG